MPDEQPALYALKLPTGDIAWTTICREPMGPYFADLVPQDRDYLTDRGYTVVRVKVVEVED